jgi:hypothetical protein
MTIVSNVALDVVAIVARWVQSPSSYDTIFAAHLRRDWAQEHRPILSMPGGRHFLYNGYHPTEPKGWVVVCHQAQCQLNGAKHGHHVSKSKVVKITCGGCKSETRIPLTTSDRSHPLEHKELVKVSFPPPQVRTHWVFPKDIEPWAAVGLADEDNHEPSSRLKASSIPIHSVSAPSSPPQSLPPTPDPPAAESLKVELPGPSRLQATGPINRSHSAPEPREDLSKVEEIRLSPTRLAPSVAYPTVQFSTNKRRRRK